MDAGLAAVLGALAGSVSTIGASIATSRAQREEARIAARASNRQQLRAPRENAYRAFIESSMALLNQTDIFRSDPTATDHVTPELSELVDGLAKTVTEKWLDVALAGPPTAEQAARAIMKTAGDVHIYVRITSRSGRPIEFRSPISRARNHVLRLGREIDKFVLIAERSLNDDGSKD